MKSVVRWATRNSPAMNTLMIGVMVVGVVSLLNLRREVFPEFELEIVLVSVPYPGATAEEVEEAICQRLEKAVHSIDRIKKRTAIAQENGGFLMMELETGSDAQKILNEVRSEVDRIPSFPAKAEKPEVQQVTMRMSAVRIAVIGPESEGRKDELQLRRISERIRDDLIHLMPDDLKENKSIYESIVGFFRPQSKTTPIISQAEITGARNFQIDVEIPEATLRQHNLTLKKVAEKIRTENMELPGGLLKGEGQEVIVKGKTKALTGEEIKKLPLIVNQEDNVHLTVGDLATVRDEFEDAISVTRVDGKPAMIITVSRTAREDLLAVTHAVRNYAEHKEMPSGYRMEIFEDRSIDVAERMELLSRNGLQGLALVLLALALFLNTRLAFWVALGIPISILGACTILLFTGQTLNMLTMFAFLMALGIVVDDAIVIGENIYAHRQRGVSFIKAAIDGTLEVLPSVTTSVATTVVAFMPMMFVTGVMGKFFAIMPMAMIAMLIISLLECCTLLPCHLAHKSKIAEILLKNVFYPVWLLEKVFNWISTKNNQLLEIIAARLYLPALRFAMRNPAIIVCSALAVLMVTFGFVWGEHVPYEVFPKLDSKSIIATLKFPDGVPASQTDLATRRAERAILNLNERYKKQGKPILRLSQRTVGFTTRQGMPGRGAQKGTNIGGVTVELTDTSARSVNSNRILVEWRKEWERLNGGQDFPGIESVQFASNNMGPGGKALEFRMLAPPGKFKELEEIVKKTKKKLTEYDGVEDIEDDSQPGKTEFVYRIKDRALAMGISQGDLIGTIHASYFGEEVMRLQRGRHEVKLMVRYPKDERKALAGLDEIRLRAGDGAERPVTELADKKINRSYTEINRVDQLRSITITADVDTKRNNARKIVTNLQSEFIPNLQKDNPWLRIRWEGQQQQTVESMQSLFVGFAIAMMVMYLILTINFRSFLQPFLILAIIPFGAVGAVVGHAILGLPLTMFSVLGLVALTGVVVNDSIVLMDFINHRVRSGVPLRQALLESGQRRLRPVILTSVTTIAGLLPLLMETSTQAQYLIPMAVSLCFGLMVTTFLVLFLVPTFYSIYSYFCSLFARFFHSDDETEDVSDDDGLAVESDDAAQSAPHLKEQPSLIPVTNGDIIRRLRPE